MRDSDKDRDPLGCQELLANDRRRYALEEVLTQESPVTLGDLARHVSARETAATAKEVAYERVKQTYISLYHVHVPKLADAGVLRYEEEFETVALARPRDRVEEWLDSCRDERGRCDRDGRQSSPG